MRSSANILRALFAILLLSAAVVSAISPDRFSINGFTSFRVEKQVDETGFGDPNYSFNAELFDLLMNFQIGEKMRVVSNLSWNHGVDRDFGYSSLEYAFIEHTFLDEIKFRVGKISTPFGLFNELRLAGPAYYSVDIPFSVSSPARLFTNGYGFYPAQGAGLALQGEGTFDYDKNFEYNLFLSNGIQDSTRNPYQSDGNRSKSLTVRTRFDFNRHLKLGKSIYLDNLSGGGKNLLFSDGYDMEFTYGNFRALGELTVGLSFGETIDTTDAVPIQTGWYLQGSYSFESGLTPYSRLERLSLNFSERDLSGKAENNTSSLILLGVNYEFSNWYTLKAEVDYYFFGRGNHYGKVLAGPDLSGTGFTEVKTSLVIGF